jgi:hypothetical protein
MLLAWKGPYHALTREWCPTFFRESWPGVHVDANMWEGNMTHLTQQLRVTGKRWWSWTCKAETKSRVIKDIKVVASERRAETRDSSYVLSEVMEAGDCTI